MLVRDSPPLFMDPEYYACIVIIFAPLPHPSYPLSIVLSVRARIWHSALQLSPLRSVCVCRVPMPVWPHYLLTHRGDNGEIGRIWRVLGKEGYESDLSWTVDYSVCYTAVTGVLWHDKREKSFVSALSVPLSPSAFKRLKKDHAGNVADKWWRRRERRFRSWGRRRLVDSWASGELRGRILRLLWPILKFTLREMWREIVTRGREEFLSCAFRLTM